MILLKLTAFMSKKDRLYRFYITENAHVLKEENCIDFEKSHCRGSSIVFDLNA